MIRLERAADGSLVTFLTDNAQHMGTPFSETRLRGDSLLLRSDRMGVRFRSVVPADERVIEGRGRRGVRSATLPLTPVEESAADETTSTTPSCPQHPEGPYP